MARRTGRDGRSGRVDVTPEEEREIRAARMRYLNSELELLVSTAMQFHAEESRTDGFHRARQATIRRDLLQMVRYVYEADSALGRPIDARDLEMHRRIGEASAKLSSDRPLPRSKRASAARSRTTAQIITLRPTSDSPNRQI